MGAERGDGVDLYLAATKVYFAAVAGRNVILDVTLRRTRADQFGLLGFGSSGAGGDGYSYEPEVSGAIWLADSLLLGAEYRKKPNNPRGIPGKQRRGPFPGMASRSRT